MKYRPARYLLLTLLATLFSPAFAGSIILGVNLEFVDGRFNDEAFDGGWGLHLGYEFKEWKKWQFGAMFEYMDGWYDPEDLEIAGEMMYDSARPTNWPLLFKAGIVDADYRVLQQDFTQDFRDVSDTGYAYGVALVFGNENFRLDLLDIKRIKIGSDTFTSYGISLGVLFGGGGGITFN